MGDHGPNCDLGVLRIGARRVRLQENRARHRDRAAGDSSCGASSCVRYQVPHAGQEAERQDDGAGDGPSGVGRRASGVASDSRKQDALCDGKGVHHDGRTWGRVPEVNWGILGFGIRSSRRFFSSFQGFIGFYCMKICADFFMFSEVFLTQSMDP